MPKPANRIFEILLVEDNAADAALLQDRLKECDGPGKQCNVRWIMNSGDVIPFLRSPEMVNYVPNLIVLDYKMPIDGGRALTELKGDPDFLHIPVVVLTGSTAPKDICDIYRRGANCCYHKPGSLDDYDKLVTTITDHWLSQICVPACHTERS